MKYDVYYYLQNSLPNDGIELRYSLRSLSNIEHGEVHFLGGCPRWAKNVTHIPYPEDPRGKFFNLMQHIRRMAKHKGNTRHVIYLADDYYVTEPMKIVPRYVNTLAKRAEWAKGQSMYRQGFRNTLALLTEMGYEDTKNFDIHVPQLLDREAIPRKLLRNSDVVLNGRSLTANLQDIPAEPLQKDCKVTNPEKLEAWHKENYGFLSSNERTFSSSGVQAALQRLFPAKSDYEK